VDAETAWIFLRRFRHGNVKGRRMNRFLPALLTILLFVAGFCPSLCMARAVDSPGNHSCCHHRQQKNVSNVCGHASVAQDFQSAGMPGVSVAASAPPMAVRVEPVAVMLPPAPRPVKLPPKTSAVLRI
jgi:hypothetical protein